jgi:hypothetical protein
MELLEPGTWWMLDSCEIHACISLSPSVHASREFFSANDSKRILDVWRATEETREKSGTREAFGVGVLPKELPEWPGIQTLDPLVESAIEMYEYGQKMVVRGKSDQVTIISELCEMLPLVRDWIERVVKRP